MLAQDSVQERLTFPRGLAHPQAIPPVPADERPQPSPALRAARRGLLGLGGGASPLPPPDRAPHRDPILALVQRITHGFNLADYEHAKELGFEGYVEEQLDHLSVPDTFTQNLIQTMYPVVGMTPKEVYDTYSEIPDFAFRGLKGATLARAASSKRQLFERMCEFWSDHFNIDHNKGLVWLLLPQHDKSVIRRHALGTFPELLAATAFSGAMQFYLDNWLNVREAPQENYARELMELHTLGVLGGYNEATVKEVAKCFTGWTLDPDEASPDWLKTVFVPAQHTQGEKFVLGEVISAGPPHRRPGDQPGRGDAQEVIDLLVAHPSTPRFLAQKLIAWFLTPTPPEELIDQVVEAYTSTNGDIKAMLRVILTRGNFSAHSPLLAPKYRRPLSLMTAAFRAMDAWVNRPDTSLGHLAGMGQSPFDYPQPTGYPDTFEAWGSSLQPRWNFTATYLRYNVLFRGIHSILPADLAARLEFQDASDRPGLARRMNERVFGQSLTVREEEVLQHFIDTYPALYDLAALYDTLVLGTSLPGFQWY